MKTYPLITLMALLLPHLATAQDTIGLNFEDFNDQDVFNNISGNWGELEGPSPGSGSVVLEFDATEYHGYHGVSMRIDYSVPASSGFAGLWESLIGRIDYPNFTLDFTDLYGDLQNSLANPTDIETVAVRSFHFWAKGRGDGSYDHTAVKVEFKDVNELADYKIFNIPDEGGWANYEFAVDELSGIDLTCMKSVAFVIEDWRNPQGIGGFYLDDLVLEIEEEVYDAAPWPDTQFLDLVGHRCFSYFLRFHDTLGFALDRSTFSDLVSTGAIGFQLAAYCIGHQLGWADGLESRIQGILENLYALPMGGDAGTEYAGYRGFYYHFLEANVGTRKDLNTELSLYDTALLMYGVLVAKASFPQNEAIQGLADGLYNRVEWDWFVDNSHADQFYLGWTPESGFSGHADGYTDELLLACVLGLGSSTHPISMATYGATKRNSGSYPPGGPAITPSWTGSLFTYFFGSCWLDLEKRGRDEHATTPLDIWENNCRAAFANRLFCIDHQDDVPGDGDDDYTTYGPESWGLTACDNLTDPDGPCLSEYYAFGTEPTEQKLKYGTEAPHLGTIATYGAGSSIIFMSTESVSALRHYYSDTGLWCPLFGLGDAYSTDPHWFLLDEQCRPLFDELGNLIIEPGAWMNGPWINHMLMGIDEGPMMLALENQRSGLVWGWTDHEPHIQAGLNAVFGTVTATLSCIPASGTVPFTTLFHVRPKQSHDLRSASGREHQSGSRGRPALHELAVRVHQPLAGGRYFPRVGTRSSRRSPR